MTQPVLAIYYLSISSIVVDVHFRFCRGSTFLLKLLALSSLLLRIGMVRHRGLLSGWIGGGLTLLFYLFFLGFAHHMCQFLAPPVPKH